MAGSSSAAHHCMVGVVAGCCFPCGNVTSTSGGPLSPLAFTHHQGGSGHPLCIPLASPSQSVKVAVMDRHAMRQPHPTSACCSSLFVRAPILAFLPFSHPVPFLPVPPGLTSQISHIQGFLSLQESAFGTSQSEPWHRPFFIIEKTSSTHLGY